MIPPYPPLVSAFSSSTSAFTPCFFASSTVSAANSTGWRSDGGVFTQSRAVFTASATTRACSSAAFASLPRAWSVSTVRSPVLVFLFESDLYAVNEYRPSSAPSATARTLSGSGAGSASATDWDAFVARTAAPAARRRSSVLSSPSGACPSPTATSAIAFTPRAAASLVTSPALPLAPTFSSTSASFPSYAWLTDSVPAGSVTPLSPFTTPITTTSDFTFATSVLLRLMVATGVLSRWAAVLRGMLRGTR